VITHLPALLHGVVLLVSADGGSATIYAGRDAGSGLYIGRFEAKSDTSRPINFRPPLDCDGGIYVSVGTNVTEVLVLWEPR